MLWACSPRKSYLDKSAINDYYSSVAVMTAAKK